MTSSAGRLGGRGSGGQGPEGSRGPQEPHCPPPSLTRGEPAPRPRGCAPPGNASKCAERCGGGLACSPGSGCPTGTRTTPAQQVPAEPPPAARSSYSPREEPAGRSRPEWPAARAGRGAASAAPSGPERSSGWAGGEGALLAKPWEKGTRRDPGKPRPAQVPRGLWRGFRLLWALLLSQCLRSPAFRSSPPGGARSPARAAQTAL